MAETETLQRPTPVGRGNTYTDEAKASALAALDANKGNLRRTARQTGLPVSTLQDFLRQEGSGYAERVRTLRAQKREELSSAFTDIAWLAVSVAADRLPEASARDAMVCAGIANQNSLTLRGMPTQIVGHLDARLAKLNDDQLDTIERWLAEADQRQPTVSGNSAICQPVDTVDMTDGSRRETVEAHPERARDGRGALQGGGARAAEQPADGTLGETAAARQLDGPDALVGQDGAQPRGKRVGG